ncbi:MAG: hmc operon protein 4 [Deltaproteobacteria bacterium]|nr:hmc operon protein 4 [Deltaproteobacteria bacterium]
MENGFHVLQDFTSFIKGSGYLSAAFLLLFLVALWIFLTGEDNRRE